VSLTESITVLLKNKTGWFLSKFYGNISQKRPTICAKFVPTMEANMTYLCNWNIWIWRK